MESSDEERRAAAGSTPTADVAPRPEIPDDTTSVELAESMDAVEFYADEGVYRASYDRARDPTSLAVVAMVATAYCRGPAELDPLQSATDVDELDTSFSSSEDGARSSVSFHYEGFDVTVFDGGTIEAAPLTNAR